MGEGLEGFAQTHVVCQQAVGALPFEVLQPAHTLPLVGPQLGTNATVFPV